MSKSNLIVAGGIAAYCAIWGAKADEQSVFSPAKPPPPLGSIFGSVKIDISGSFNTPIPTSGGNTQVVNTVRCGAKIYLVPSSVSAAISKFSLGQILNRAGAQDIQIDGTISTPSTFSCSPTVYYRWNSVQTSLFNLAIVYSVNYSRTTINTSTFVTTTTNQNKHDLIKTIVLPSNGTITDIATSPTM